MRSSSLLLMAILAVLPWGAGTAAGAARFVDLETYSADTSRFWEVNWELRRDYEEACAASRCHGWDADHRPLRLRCSVEAATGQVAECRWLFAAVHIFVDPSNGVPHALSTLKDCVLPLAPGTSAMALVAALSVPEPLDANLPGRTDRVWDVRTRCLNGDLS